jgi:hypothetical protein
MLPLAASVSNPVFHHVPSAASSSAGSEFHASARPVVINLSTANVDGSREPSAAPDASTNAQQQQQSGAVGGLPVPSLKMVLKAFEGSLPFILIVFAKVVFDHRLGILVFAAMCGTMFQSNASLRRLLVQRETQRSTESVAGLLWLIVFLSANILFFYYVFEDQKLYRSLYLMCPEVDKMSLWSLLWITATTDFLVKYSTIVVKALIALVPQRLLSNKQKGNWYMMVEMLSQTYRCLLPITPWIYFLFDDQQQDGRRWFSTILFVIYIVCKAYHLLTTFRLLGTACTKFRLNLIYGTAPSHSQLESCDNLCPICHDKLTQPIALNCSHVFCESCIATWFNRERSCPLCRSVVVDTPQWRDGTTNTSLQLY